MHMVMHGRRCFSVRILFVSVVALVAFCYRIGNGQEKATCVDRGVGHISVVSVSRIHVDTKEMILHKRDLAKKVFDLKLALFRQNLPRSRAEDVYCWSRRWLEAELDIDTGKGGRRKAYEMHLRRMRDLANLVNERAAGSGLQDEAASIDYYITECEVWMDSGKNL